jgi:hypothetical protein
MTLRVVGGTAVAEPQERPPITPNREVLLAALAKEKEYDMVLVVCRLAGEGGVVHFAAQEEHHALADKIARAIARVSADEWEDNPIV